jgi:transposase, IS5 family
LRTPLSISNHKARQAKSQDSLLWQQVREIFAGFEQVAYAKELESVIENLHDEELLEALESERWTGRPGYSIGVMWRTWIASYVRDIPTIQELIRTLHRDPLLAVRCGIHSDQEIPTRFAYYRFRDKLIAHKDIVEKCMAKTVEALQRQLPGFGEVVAIDSTDIESYVNWSRKPLSDQDARWGWRKGKDGKDEMYPGYKMHLASTMAGNREIPLIPVVTPANANDSPLMIPLLQKNAALIEKFSPKFILGDKGYDAGENYKALIEQFKAVPIIDLNLRGRKGKPNRFEDVADEQGMPYCAFGLPYVFWGYEKKQKRLKYRCPLACGKQGCTWIDKCSKSSYGEVVKIKLEDDYRRFIQVPRHTKRWKELYNKRTSIERVFSGLKKDDGGKLVNHRIRGLQKITLNSLLAVWVVQAKALEKGEVQK